jgi:hypothetical protein
MALDQTETTYTVPLRPSQATAAAGNVDFDDIYSFNARAIELIVDLTAFVTAASLTGSIDLKDPNSGKYINLITGAAIVANGTQRLRVSPDLAAVANAIAQDHAPAVFRVRIAHGNANSHTYSVSLIRHGK